MALIFPSNPTLNQIFSTGSLSWIWNGKSWNNGTSILVTSNLVSGSAQFTNGNSAAFDTTSNVTFGQVTASFAKITGSIFGTASFSEQAFSASYALSASYVLNAVSASYSLTSSFSIQSQTASFVTTAQTASYVLLAQTASYVTLAQTASYISTASYALAALSASYAPNIYVLPTNVVSSSAQLSNGGGVAFDTNSNITVNQITASFAKITNLTVEYVTSSVMVITGSNKFGDASNDTQEFTGSVSMSGSLSVVGNVTSNNVLSLASGTVALPSLILSTDTTSGMYRIGANNIGISISAAKVLDISSTGLSVTGALSATGRATFSEYVVLSDTYPISWGGVYGVGKPSIAGSTANGGTVSLYPTGPTNGAVVTVSATGLTTTGTLSATNGYNGTVGATTPSTGAFTTLSASSNLTVLGGAAYSTGGIGAAGKQLISGYDTTNSIGYLRSANNGVAFTQLNVDGSTVIVSCGAGTLAPVGTFTSTGLAITGALSCTTGANFATSSGAVNIGPSVPSFGAKLNISNGNSAQSSVLFLNPGVGSGQIGIAAAGSNFKLYNTYADGLLANGLGIDIASTGHVGIGTTTPLCKTEVYDSAVLGAFVPATRSTWRVLQIKNFQRTNSESAAGISFQGDNANGDTGSAGIVGINNNTTGGVMSLAFLTALGNVSVERARIDSSGNVGIGTTSPGTTLDVQAANASFRVYGTGASDTPQFQLRNGSQIWQQIVDGADSNKWKLRTGGGTTVLNCDPSAFGLAVTGALSSTGNLSTISDLRITDSGGSKSILIGNQDSGGTNTPVILRGVNATLQIGTGTSWSASGGGTLTTIANFSSTGVAVTGALSATSHLQVNGETFANSNSMLGASFTNAFAGASLRSSDDSSGVTFQAFRKSNNTVIGSISRVTTTDAVAYNTTSDGRLKENLRDFTDSGRLIDSLKPRVFDWKNSDENGKNVVGFIAQEEHAADPIFAHIGAVTVGDEDPETITKQWQRSDSALIPILVAELKALRQRVAALESK